MKCVRRVAFVPAHISGFFQPFILRSPEKSGSRNCGPCLEIGVKTAVRVKPSEKTRIEVRINGGPADAPTTLFVAREIISMTEKKYNILIDHTCKVPICAGYGISGAGALGTALALSAALGLRKSREELQCVAHSAEVVCRTGLGDVVAQTMGGLILTLSPGAAPYGRWRRIPVPDNMRVVCATIGELKTRDILYSPKIMKRAKLAGKRAFERVRACPSLREFLEASRNFMDGLGLADEEVAELVNTAESCGAIGASQAMLGRSIFAFCTPARAKRVREGILNKRPDAWLAVTGVSKRGAEIQL